MARIEKNDPMLSEVGKMEGRLMDAVKPSSRRRWGRVAALVVVAVVLALAGLVAWTVASTGLVRIPLVSRYAFVVPEPARGVGEGVPFTVAVEQQLSEQAARAIAAGREPTSAEILVSETTLTAELRDSLETSGQTFFDSEEAQVAVLPGVVEVFLPVADNASGTALTLWLEAELGPEGEWNVRATEATLGAWDVPGWVRERVANPALRRFLDGFRGQVDGLADVTGFGLVDGFVRANIELK